MTASQSINVTPSPQILEVIAEVDLQVHHCLAELIDNALDELKDASSEDGEFEPRIDIDLPFGVKVTRDSKIHVADNGRGMSVEALERALSAGTSGKAKLGSLGMFGMGFNIATTRLGSLTEVRTGRRGDEEWVVASIDIQRMIEEGSYEIPLRREPKQRDESGTMITVTRLKDDIVSKLSSNRAARDTKVRLGRIYTYMLRDPEGAHSGASLMGGENFRFYVNGQPVDPVVPCIWDPSRSVTIKGAEVPAAREIDFQLSDAYACLGCGRFYAKPQDTCLTCGGTDIQQRERRILGWLGVQRYGDPNDFGIGFFRQGRCLVDRDKSLFDWFGPDGEVEKEYPELRDGRLVGEVHLDFAKPQVRKTDFDRESRDWIEMRELVRGDGPMRPRIAQVKGFPENTSPLGVLFSAYQRPDPGLKRLMPGDGKNAINESAKSWARLFRDGDPSYVTDEKWYEAAKAHDDIATGKTVPADSEPETSEDEWLNKEGLGDLGKGEKQPAEPQPDPEPKPETDDERFARYREAARLVPGTDREVTVSTAKVTLRVYAVSGVELVDEGVVSTFTMRLAGGQVEAFVDEESPFIRDFGWSTIDVAFVCLAPRLKRLYRFEDEVDDILLALLEQFPDRKVDAGAVRSRGEAILDAIRSNLEGAAPKAPDRFWNALTPRARQASESAAIAAAGDVDWSQAIESGSFVNFVDPGAVVDLVTAIPEDVLDGKVFTTTFDALGPDSREEQTVRLMGLLTDLSGMVKVGGQTGVRELRRFLASADLLDQEVASE